MAGPAASTSRRQDTDVHGSGSASGMASTRPGPDAAADGAGVPSAGLRVTATPGTTIATIPISAMAAERPPIFPPVREPGSVDRPLDERLAASMTPVRERPRF